MSGIVIKAQRVPKIAPELIDRWAKVPVTIISDVLVGEGLLPLDIKPLRRLGEKVRLAGLARTAACKSPDFGAVMHAVNTIEAGEVLVIAAGGDSRIAYIGEVLGGVLREKRAAGVICDGAVRDAGGLSLMDDLPVYTRATTAHGPLAKENGTVNAPVMIDSVAVSPGDLILGDEDGVICLSPETAADRIDAAEAQVAVEETWLRQLGEGVPFKSVFGLPDVDES